MLAAFIANTCAYARNITLSNAYMRVALSGADYRVISLFDIQNNIEFINPATSARELWEATVCDKNTNPLKINNGTPCAKRFALTGNSLELVYRNISISNEANAVDVICTINLDGQRLVWGINVVNRSKQYDLWETRYPILNLAAIGGNSSDDAFVAPYGHGVLLKDPLNFKGWYPATWAFWHTESGKDTYANRQGRQIPAFHNGMYPSFMQNMQFQCYYDENSGFYIATEDPDANIKDFLVLKQEGGLQFSIRHYPAGITRTNEYSPPYPVVTRLFEGDWYDASQIYKAWATNQVWCVKGNKRDIPRLKKWYNELAVWHIAASEDLAYVHEHVVNTTPPVGNAAYFLNKWAKGWQKDGTSLFGFPSLYRCANPERMKKLMALRKNGAYGFPYVDINDWNPEMDNFDDEGKKAARKDINHETYYDVYGKMKTITMCPASKIWQDKMADNAKYLVDNFNVDAIYLDVFVSQEEPFCFDPAHGHSLGGGNWIKQGKLDIVKAVRAAKPDLVIAGEGRAECYIGAVDCGFEIQPSRRPDIWIPLYASVYNPYTDAFMWGNYVPDLEKPPSFCVKLAHQMSFGVVPGFLTMTTEEELLKKKTEYARELDFLRKMIAYRFRHRDFLAYGERLREPDGKVNNIHCVWATSKRDKVGLEVDVPAITASAWRSPDGKTGLSFINGTFEKQEGEYNINWDEYQPGDSKKISWVSHDTDGAETKGKYSMNDKIKVTLAPASAKMMVFSPTSAETLRGKLRRLLRSLIK